MNPRFVILGVMLASATLTAVPAAIDVSPMFIWNASASVGATSFANRRRVSCTGAKFREFSSRNMAHKAGTTAGKGTPFFQLPLAHCPRSVSRSSSRSPHIPTPVRKLGTIAAQTRHSKDSRFFVRRFTKLLAPTASVPIGLYRVLPEDHLGVADLVAVTPPEPIAKFLAARNYLPRGVPLLKHVLGLPGQIVCRIRLDILIDDTVMATARERDRYGRPLPDWQGCRTIAEGEVFLMNWQSTDSLDGRYFGPLPAASIIGRAVPLYTFEAP